MKITTIIGPILIHLNESHEDLKFVTCLEFEPEENGTRDFALTLEDLITGVIYAIDFKLAKDGNFKINTIDIQDSSQKTERGSPTVSSGNNATFDIVNNYIAHNLKSITSHAVADGWG